jgi:SAM-dependent methyltransferase
MAFELPRQDELHFVRDIAPNDWMMPSNRSPEWYYQRGFDALQVIAFECHRARLAPSSILDFGCGHGAVARMLKAFFHTATIIGQDVNPEWLRWCEDHLSIHTVLSASKISDVEMPANAFDLIWAGSVFSHIPEDSARHLLLEFRKALTEKGLVIFSSAGQLMRNAYRPGAMHNLSDEVILRMARDFDLGAYAFGAYDTSLYENWGHSLVPWNWFASRSREFDMPMCAFLEAGWGSVQDIYALRKTRNFHSWR